MKILTAKDIAYLLHVSIRTAYTYLNDMKQYYKPKSNKITIAHFNDYFSIPCADNDK